MTPFAIKIVAFPYPLTGKEVMNLVERTCVEAPEAQDMGYLGFTQERHWRGEEGYAFRIGRASKDAVLNVMVATSLDDDELIYPTRIYGAVLVCDYQWPVETFPADSDRNTADVVAEFGQAMLSTLSKG